MLALFDSCSQLPAAEASQAIAQYATRHIAQSIAEPLTCNGLQLSPRAIAALQEQRTCALAETERVELGPGALPLIAEALASSPFLLQSNLFDALALAQQTFYRLRDDIPIDIPDEELAEALRGCFDQFEGDLNELEALDAREIFGNYDAHDALDDAIEEFNAFGAYTDEWSYDEFADGWDGEKWGDDLD